MANRYAQLVADLRWVSEDRLAQSDLRHPVGGSTRLLFLRALGAWHNRRAHRAALALHWAAAEWTMISGSITTKDVLLNASTIVRSFGLSTYVRCLRALLTGRRTTFLELAWPR